VLVPLLNPKFAVECAACSARASRFGHWSGCGSHRDDEFEAFGGGGGGRQ
jgi:hypothetical protein